MCASAASAISRGLPVSPHQSRKLAGIDLIVKGDTPKEKADVLLASLVDHGLAEYVEDEPPTPVTVPRRRLPTLEDYVDPP